MKRIMTCFAVLFSIGTLCATTYYASPTGSGTGTSYASPTTWASALGKLHASDTLYLLDGTYALSEKQTIGASKSGTADKRTFIGAYPGAKPVFDFRTQPYGKEVTGHDNVGVSISEDAKYMHIKNLTICYAGKNGIINNGSYCLFENLNVYGCGDSGIQMKNGGNNTILNCDSHDNFDYKLGDITASDFGGNADGFADKQHSGAGNHYIGCRAWNNSDDGWDFFQRASSSNPTIIENCICYANGPAYYNMNGHARYETDKAWFEQFKNGLDVTDADENPVHVTLTEYTNMGNGNGFKLGGKSTEHNVIVHHCLSVNNTVKGYDQNNDAGTIYLYNNTAYHNNPDYGFPNANGCQLHVQNCISYSSQSENKLTVAVTNDHNSWNSGFSVNGSDFQSRDMSLILAPRNADGSLPENTFMRLKDNSLLIDAGVNVGHAYNGSAPDLGCYESEQGESHDPTVLPSQINRIFYWQMSGSTAPANGSTLTATGGYIHTGTRDATKAYTVENAYYISSFIPEDMQAKDGKGLKLGYNALYLSLFPNEGTFHKGDTLFICGYNVWDVGTSLNTIFDSIRIDTIRVSGKNYYDIGYLVLPTNADSLVLKRHRGKGTSASSIIVCRDPSYNPATALDRTKDCLPGKSEKILRDGQLFIRREDQLYTPTGQRVQ